METDKDTGGNHGQISSFFYGFEKHLKIVDKTSGRKSKQYALWKNRELLESDRNIRALQVYIDMNFDGLESKDDVFEHDCRGKDSG